MANAQPLCIVAFGLMHNPCALTSSRKFSSASAKLEKREEQSENDDENGHQDLSWAIAADTSVTSTPRLCETAA